MECEKKHLPAFPTGRKGARAAMTAVCIAALASALAVGVGAGEGRTTLRVGLSKAPSALPVLRMMEAGLLGDGITLEFDVWNAPEQLLAMARGGRHQLFSLPLTLAARMSNRGLDIRLSNVNTWGGIWLITSDPDIRSWRDVKGRELFLPPRGSPPEALARFFLLRAGLDPDADVTLKYAPIAETAQLLRAGRIAGGVLIEPQATAALSGTAALRRAFDFEEEWRREGMGAGRLPNLGFGGPASFYENERELAERFERAYAEALDWVVKNPGPAGEMAERRLGLRADLIAEAMPRLGLSYMDASAAAPVVEEYFRALFEVAPDLIGDRVPDATLYWR